MLPSSFLRVDQGLVEYDQLISGSWYKISLTPLRQPHEMSSSYIYEESQTEILQLHKKVLRLHLLKESRVGP